MSKNEKWQPFWNAISEYQPFIKLNPGCHEANILSKFCKDQTKFGISIVKYRYYFCWEKVGRGDYKSRSNKGHVTYYGTWSKITYNTLCLCRIMQIYPLL